MDVEAQQLAGTSRIRLALIIPTLDQGGAEKQLVTLATQIDRNRFSPHVITLSRSGPYRQILDQAQVPVFEVNKRGKFDPMAFRRLRKILQDIKPQIVHTWLFAANAYGRLAALKQAVPVILGGERCVDPWKRGWQFFVDRYLSKRTTGILTNSSAVRDFYALHGIAPEKFMVIPNGIKPSTQEPISRAEALRRLNLPSTARVFGTVGRMWPQKGYKELIWAAGMLHVVRPDFHYVILGEGPQQPLLEQFRDVTGAVGCVHFAGHRNDINQLLPHFDMYWNGSLYEGQSNSIMEAMQAGVPVIATDIPGNRDLIEHEKCGFLYPVGAADQLAKYSTRILDDQTLRENFIRNAKQRIESQFSVQQMVKSHEAFYVDQLQSAAHAG